MKKEFIASVHGAINLQVGISKHEKHSILTIEKAGKEFAEIIREECSQAFIEAMMENIKDLLLEENIEDASLWAHPSEISSVPMSVFNRSPN